MNEAEQPRDIAPMRQPMITSLGIILGFLLNFMANWATNDDGSAALATTADFVVAATLFAGITLMGIVLYRLLDVRHPESQDHQRYLVTFRLYFAAIIVAFGGIGLSLLL